MSRKRKSSEPRTEPRTEPTITPVWFGWEDKLPPTGADELVEDDGAEDKVEVGTAAEVVGGEGRVRVEGRDDDVVEGVVDVEEGVARVEEGVAEVEEGVSEVEEGVAEVEEGVAVMEDVGVEIELVGEEAVDKDDDGVGGGEDNPP